MMDAVPIPSAHLFPELDAHLLTLLRSLSPDDWHRPTVCSLWTVKDIASHLLDGTLRRLSAQRDGYAAPDAPAAFSSHEGLVGYLNRLNAEWTAATRRLSPAVLIGLLEVTGPELAELFRGLDPFARAIYPVGWAGEAESPNWFDVAREYTEKWHHQQQIWLAVGRPDSPIMSRRLYRPVLDAFMRALPHTFRDVPALEGTAVKVTVTGEAGGDWVVARREGRWSLDGDSAGRQAAAVVTLGPDVAWRVFTKRTDAGTVLRRFPSITVDGDRGLGRKVLEAVSIMA